MEDFLSRAMQDSRTLYQSAAIGTVVVQVETPSSSELSGSTTVLITEHRPFLGQQYRYYVPIGSGITRTLPVGEYSIVVFGNGYKPYRTYVEVAERQVSTITARLE